MVDVVVVNLVRHLEKFMAVGRYSTEVVINSVVSKSLA